MSGKQFGFREGRSTQDAVTYLTGKIAHVVDIKTPVICIFVDLGKAFDTVSHIRLLETLGKMGFRGKITSRNKMLIQ